MAIDWQSRRDGFDHRKYKPTDAPINWKYWGSLQGIKQWDACALSLNINPDCLKAKKMAIPGKPEFLDASFPSEAALIEFYDRLTMLNRLTQGNYLAPVNPAWFAAWCVRIELADLPPELVAMALQPAPVAQTAPATDTAKPMPVATASDGPAPLPAVPNWKMLIQAEADAHCLRLRKAGANPTKHSILDSMAQWCRDNNVMTDGNIFPSANYLRAHVLGGKHWEVPN